MIEKIYCISLKNNLVRRNLMHEQLQNEYSDQYKIIDAYTSENPLVLNAYNNLTLKKSNIEALSQVAICFSHIECLKKIVKKKYIYGAIIEDDIRIRKNSNNIINDYLNNTPELKQIMSSEPCIIHICGPYNNIQKINRFKERDSDIIVNICFYIVNHMLAKILVDNFYPIKWQFDTYVSKLCREMKIKEYIACPILAWDLSSGLYSNFWTKEDLEIKKYITSTSKINRVNEIKIKSNIYFQNNEQNLSNNIFQAILENYKQYKKSDQNECHYLFPSSELKHVNNKTIITGQGVADLNEKIDNPFLVLFVRGPLTRNNFIECGIVCPELYIDPLILYSKINKIKVEKKMVCIRSKYIFLLDFDYQNIIERKSVLIKNIKKEKLKDIIDYIKFTDIIISNIYEILVLSTSYNKKTIPIYIKNKQFDIRYLDYVLGYKNIINNWGISKLNYLYFRDVLDLALANENIFYPQIDFSELKYKQKKLSTMLPFIN